VTGFSNPIIGGGGGLVYPSIHSPNFSLPAQTGWAILKNGDAYFYQLTIAGGSIIVGASGGGVFFYNGTPGLGNAPIFAIVAPGTTKDPFGNTVQAVMNIGSLSGAHLGADDSGNLYLADPTGDTRIYMSPSLQLLAFYTAGTARLLMTLAGSAGTDPLSHSAYPQGLKFYGSNGSYIRLDDNGTVATLFLGGGAASEQNPGKLATTVEGTTPNYEVLDLIGPQYNSPYGDYCWIELQSSYSDGSSYAGANLFYTDRSGTQHLVLEWGEGGIFARNITDGGAYDIQALHLIATPINQPVTSTTPAVITGLSQTVAAGTYVLRGVMRAVMGSTSAALNIGLNGPAASVTYLDISFFSPYPTTTSQIIQTLALGNTTNSATITNGDDCQIRIDGYITFTAPGTLEVTAAEHTSGDSWTLVAGVLDLMPVTV
jgi:hypothetical protein